MADWQDFEELVEQIQRATAPGAIVRRNHRVKGRISGSVRQLDVTLSKRIGLHDVLIVIECKKYKRKVTIDKVEAFATKLMDVGASQGVMISPLGFESGAHSVAEKYSITLQTLTEAREVDWEGVMGIQSWVSLTFPALDKLEVEAFLDNTTQPLNADDILYHEQNNPAKAVRELVDFVLDHLKQDLPMGRFELNSVVQPIEPPIFAEIDGAFKRICNLRITGVNTIREHTINLKLASAYILQDASSGTHVYSKVTTQSINWPELIAKQEGRELTSDEYAELLGNENVSSTSVTLHQSRPYIRFVIESHRND